jgi:hypothetical protein
MHMSCPTRPSVGLQPASNSIIAHQPFSARQPKPRPTAWSTRLGLSSPKPVAVDTSHSCVLGAPSPCVNPGW